MSLGIFRQELQSSDWSQGLYTVSSEYGSGVIYSEANKNFLGPKQIPATSQWEALMEQSEPSVVLFDSMIWLENCQNLPRYPWAGIVSLQIQELKCKILSRQKRTMT